MHFFFLARASSVTLGVFRCWHQNGSGDTGVLPPRCAGAAAALRRVLPPRFPATTY